MKTYLFYDVETSGLNPAFDQILTFACIRTDLSLQEIDRQTITVQLRKDIVPSPRAFLTHGLTHEELSSGITEYHAAKKIHQLVNEPGTISLGYNSLGFDDNFLRFLFYRNLLDPYSHQYSNGCSRMDILPITTVFRVFHPGCLHWPHIDGKPSLKLESIATENQFVTSGRAHEAMNDVEALVALSKVLYAQADIWKYCLDFFNKTRDEIRINSIEKTFEIDDNQFSTAIMVSASFGHQSNYLSPAIHIGSSSVYKNQSLWLRLDAENILGIEEKLSVEDTFVTRKRSGDALIVLPPLERFWNKIPEKVRDIAIANKEKIRQNPERFFEFIEYHTAYKYPLVPDMDADAALYQDGFFTREEKKQIQMFHAASISEKAQIVDNVSSPRVKILAKRILARNFENTCELPKEFEGLLYLESLRLKDPSRSIVGYKNDTKLCCEEALLDLNDLEKELALPDQEQKRMLLWLKEHIKNL